MNKDIKIPPAPGGSIPSTPAIIAKVGLPLATHKNRPDFDYTGCQQNFQRAASLFIPSPDQFCPWARKEAILRPSQVNHPQKIPVKGLDKL